MKDSGVVWIGEIPSMWPTVQLGSIFSEHKHKNTGMQSNNLLSLSYGNIVRKDINTLDGLLPESFEGYNVIGPGDIVLRLTDLQNDQRSLRVGICQERGIVTSAYVTLRLRDFSMNSLFFYYLIHSYDIRKGFYGMGAGVRQGLNYAGIKKIMLPVPPLAEQKLISGFLLEQETKVGKLIANVQSQIEKLKAYKQSLITEAVTKGLDPTVPMKDSGIEWIGKIPEDWEVKPLLREIETIVDYRGKTPEKVDEGILLVTARNIKDGRIDYDISREYVKPEEYDQIMHRGRLNIGDLLFTTEAPLGAVANVDRTDFALAQRIIKFSTKASMNPYYLKYWMLSPIFQQHLKSYATGSTASGIKASKLCLLQLVRPPREEQDTLASELDRKCSQIDRLIAIKQAKIEKLEQYKRSLIYEYVTGKKEVS